MTREELEGIVQEMHNAHYTPENPHGLWKPDEAPNANTIYKVWNDGEITYEKGGDAFGDRSLKQLRTGHNIFGAGAVLPTFPILGGRGYSYAMLTVDECCHVNKLLKDYFDPFMPKRVEVRVTAPPETVDGVVRKLVMRDIRVVYRSPANDMFVVQSLMGTSEEVQAKLDETLRTSLPDGMFTFTRVD